MTQTSPIEIDLSMEFSSLRVPVLCCSMDRGSSTSRPAALTTIYIGDEIPDVPGLLACARNCAKLLGRGFMLPIPLVGHRYAPSCGPGRCQKLARNGARSI